MLSNLSTDENGMQMILMVVVVALVLYLLVSYIRDHKHKQSDIENNLNNNPNNNPNNVDKSENFEDDEGFSFGAHGKHEGFDAHGKHEGFKNHEEFSEVESSSGVDNNATYGTVPSSDNVGNNSPTGGSSLPAECYPKEVLSSEELLPTDANSKWAQVNPAGQGTLTDKNFLTAGFHVGVNTVGQSLRNANRQLRSDPPNPQVKVSPWMQTTIEPDVNRKPMEIGGQ